MQSFDTSLLSRLNTPGENSHKGQNGKLLLIGGSHLFHAASLWALTIASRVVDMVFYASVPENNQIVQEAKQDFRNGIVIRRDQIDNYVQEADCILIGPGMMRTEGKVSNTDTKEYTLEEINNIADEGIQTRLLTRYLINKYSDKKFVLDAGALQMMEPVWLKKLEGRVIVTPHQKEFERLFSVKPSAESSQQMSIDYNCVVLLKGKEDIVCSPTECVSIAGGNAGMTKGGTGDVLAGLVASLACNNDMWVSACAGSFFNKRAGESLEKRMGIYFNASDLALEIPAVMANELGQ